MEIHKGKPSLKARAAVLRMRLDHERRERIRSNPFARRLDRAAIEVVSTPDGYTVVERGEIIGPDTVEDRPRKVRGFIHRQSHRLDDHRTGRRAFPVMEYRRHPRVRTRPDGTQVLSFRSDAWARARSPQEGSRRLALVLMRRTLPLGNSMRGSGPGVDGPAYQPMRPTGRVFRVNASGESRLFVDRDRRIWTGSAPEWVDVTVPHHGRTVTYQHNRITGEDRIPR